MAIPYKDLRDNALVALKNYMDLLDEKNGKILAYWLNNYVKYLKEESTFDSQQLLRYKRGSIVKVDLGYRIGSEEGGLHYAIVVETNNAMRNKVITVVPLTSVKPTTDLDHLNPRNVFLGNEIYNALTSKLNTEIPIARESLKQVKEKFGTVESENDVTEIGTQLKQISRQIKYCEKINHEVDKMKQGSIALVGQIITISKQRIYDPKNPSAALFDVRVSDESLNKIDDKIRELFCNPNNE